MSLKNLFFKRKSENKTLGEKLRRVLNKFNHVRECFLKALVFLYLNCKSLCNSSP
ncbi:MAG: hypothetical protein CM15mP58_19900 [Burkholderiaceae bacterium]|nr:MAG: hypothetical protein CM15mP58_19900 [Burkholderiaceae bacterium]